MTKHKKRLSVAIILGVIIIALLAIHIKNSNPPETTKEIAECIGKESTLYVQLGCSHCEDQEELFGDNLQYLNIVDCFYEREKCGGITATPTWEIGGEYIIGVKSISELQELTGC